MSPRTRLALLAMLATLLTATSMSSVYADHGWAMPTYGAIIAVFIGAEVGARVGARLLVPTLWRAVGGLAALLMYCCARSAPGESWLGFLPTPGSVDRLRELNGQAFDDIRTLAAPVPSHAGLVLVTMAGVGLVAVAVDLLTVRAPLTGLPLLAMYSVPEWLSPHGAGLLTFIVAAVGYLALLVQEGRDRTTRWGRAVGTPVATAFGDYFSEGSAAAAIGRSGRRIGSAAVGLALLLPPLLPGLDHPHLFGFGNGPGHGDGPAVVTYNPIARIYGYLTQRDPTVQLRYAVTSGKPGGVYLQWTTLDQYDAAGWSQSDLTGAGAARDALPPPATAGLAERPAQFGAHVAVDDSLDLNWLPVPADTTAVRGLSDQWLYDARTRTIFSPHSNTRGLGYDLTALDAEPGTQTLLASPAVDGASASDDLRHYLELPPDASKAVLRKAQDLTARFHTPYQKALALQDFFTTTGGFRYDTDAGSGNGSDLLARFVLEGKRGFCEQFAGAMAVMARMVGIPARVAVGFTPGVPDGHGDEYVVSTADAHAWPELYFTGIGWLRFEPTPRSDGQATPPSYATQPPTAVRTNPTTGGTTPETRDPGSGGATNPRNRLPRGLGENSDPLAHGHLPPLTPVDRSRPLSARTLAVIALVSALVLVLLAIPSGAALSRRARRRHAHDPVSRTHVAWRDVVTDAADLGFAVRPSDSPRGVARRLADAAHLEPPAAAALDRLARAEEQARYARRPADPGDLTGDARAVGRGLRAAAGRWTRLRARALPPSTVRSAAEAVGTTVGAVFDAVEGAAARLAGALRRPLRRGA